MRVIIVGAGIMGLSAAWALARRGHEVSVVEQHAVPNPLGSSVDQHRLIRYPYGVLAGYAAMVAPAYAAWERLWGDLGERLYVETGTLAFGTTSHRWLDDSAEALAALGIPFEALDQAAIARRFPLIDPGGLDRALYQPSGGVLLADRIVARLARHLAGRGVSVEPHCAAADLDAENAAIRLADGRRLAADALVVAAGPWAGRLLPRLPVIPSRQIIAYVAPPAELAAAWRRMPMLLDIAPDVGFYLVPPVAGTAMKVGDHTFRLTGDPDHEREASAEETQAIYELCRGRLRGFDGFRLEGGRTCFYDVAAAERFIVQPVSARAWAMAGFSGHGFKFGPVLGEAVAEALEGGRAAAEVTRWAAGLAPGAPERRPADPVPQEASS